MGAKDNDFIPIRVTTLRGDQQIPFDVYVRVAGKHILYCRQGDSFEGQRLSRLKEKKIKQLFIPLSREADYRLYLSRNLELAYKAAEGKPISTRIQIIQGLQQAATEDAMDNLESKVHYDVFKNDTNKYVNFLLAENEALRHVLEIPNVDASVSHHGVNVATIAACLANHLGQKDPIVLQHLAVGCLLHDIEHLHSGLDVARPLTELTEKEMLLYRRHPDLGVARVQSTGFYDQLVLKIIRSHHESTNGGGFPDGLKENEIPDAVMIASVADAYDRLISYERTSPKDAVKQLMIDRVGLLPLDMIKGLAGLLKERGVA